MRFFSVLKYFAAQILIVEVLYAVLPELLNLTGKKSPTSISGVMNCPIVF